jgi:hypothetical protein
MLTHPLQTMKVAMGNVYRLYVSELDGLEIASESMLPETMSEEVFHKVISDLHPQIRPRNPAEYYVRGNDGFYYLNHEKNITEIDRIHLAHTIRYSFAYPYRESEGPFLRLMKATGLFAYYTTFILFLGSLVYCAGTMFSQRQKEIFLGLAIVLATTIIHALTVGGSRYHYPLMAWIFGYVSLFLCEFRSNRRIYR